MTFFIVMFVLGVWFFLGLFSVLGSKEQINTTYTGETINQLIATVDRVFRRRWLSP
jgi:hypothetical protein